MAKLTLCIAIFAAVIVASLMAAPDIEHLQRSTMEAQDLGDADVIVASLMSAPQHDEDYQNHEDLQIDEIEEEQFLIWGFAAAVASLAAAITTAAARG